MSKEASVSVSLNVNKIDATTGVYTIGPYNRSNGFTVDVAGTSGPYGTTVAVTAAGAFLSLGGVGTPGLALFTNQSATVPIYVGTYDNSTGRFTPFLRLLPGMTLPAYLPESLREWAGVTAGTASLGSDQLMAKSPAGAASLLYHVFPE